MYKHMAISIQRKMLYRCIFVLAACIIATGIAANRDHLNFATRDFITNVKDKPTKVFSDVTSTKLSNWAHAPFSCKSVGWDYSLSVPTFDKRSDVWKHGSPETIRTLCGYGAGADLKSSTRNVYVDVGANFGLAVMPYLSKGWSVFAFEPVQQNVEVLNINMRNYPRTHVFSAAVSDTEGLSNIYVPVGQEDNSAMGGANVADINVKTGNVVPHKIKTVTLDGVLLSHPDFDPQLVRVIKIDTQGHEIQVLKGMRRLAKLLPQNAKLIIENDKKLLRAAGHSSEELVELLRSMSFDCYCNGAVVPEPQHPGCYDIEARKREASDAKQDGCKETKPFEWPDQNLGNMLQSYFELVAMSLLKHCALHIAPMKLASDSFDMPHTVELSPSNFLWNGETSPKTLVPHGGLWHTPGARILHVITPVIQRIITQCLAALPKFSNEVVIHFRCSDGPYNRHWGYEFVTYQFYIDAMKLAGVTRGSQIVVLACDTWGSTNNICTKYTDKLIEFLQNQGYSVEKTCDTVRHDFNRMVQARVLISGGIGSSLSYMAALASNQTAILPTTIAAQGQRPSLENHKYNTRRGLTFLHNNRLSHSAVKDYSDIAAVHSQLVPTNEHFVVLVLSRRGDFERRQVIRDTWGKGHNNVLFMVGNEPCQAPEVDWDCPASLSPNHAHLAKEKATTKKLEKEPGVILLQMKDYYRNLPQKLKLAYKWALNTYPSVQYLLKTDDDSVVRVNTVEEWLSSLPKPSAPTVFGGIHTGTEVARSGKWAELVYKPSTYPPFPIGSVGHFVTRDIAEYVVSNMHRLHNYQGEDTSLGIWLDESPLKDRVQWVDSPHMTNHGQCKDTSKWVIGHNIGLAQMQACYAHKDELSLSKHIDKTPRVTVKHTKTAEPVDAMLANFKAADPTMHEWCVAALSGRGKGSADNVQDTFIARNFFAKYIQNNKRGFYVDSGTNHYKDDSTSWIFDKCLGWKGVCIEPNPQYHADIRAHRSCTLAPYCISETSTVVDFVFAGGTGHVSGGRKLTEKVQCHPLEYILKEVSAPLTVDFWSLDVEGHEQPVLRGVNWDSVSVKVLLIEDFWNSNRQLDYLLSGMRFVKAHQMAIDSAYVSLTALDLLPPSFVYPEGFHETWKFHVKWRNTVRQQLSDQL